MTTIDLHARRNDRDSRFATPTGAARRLCGAVCAVSLLLAPSAWALDTELVPVTDSSRPFIAALADLEGAGFVEDEYFVSGDFNVYEYDENLDLQLSLSGLDYTSRILVRRPADPADFNGIVVIEMMNPTATFDIDFMWQYAHPLILEEGYIWVGLTIRENALGFLKFWDGDRYAPLTLPDRGLTYEAYGALAALLQDPADPENPLSGYAVTHVLGTGYSQSDDWLTTFSNEFHETSIAVDGMPAFDGYLGAGGNAAAHPIKSVDPTAEDGRFYIDERRYNHVDAPYFRVHTETELAIFRYPANETRQPDSPVFRQWEIPGTTHADGVIWGDVEELFLDNLGFPLPICDWPQSKIAFAPYVRSALHHLAAWVRDGTQPPPSLWIELNGTRNIRQDEFGNALGGIREPAIAVPVATYLPYNSPFTNQCVFSGTEIPFSDEQIEALYPQHGKYVSGVAKAVNSLQKAGYLLPADAEAMKQAAAESEVSK